ncbi:MAG TPA: c-type cytochrome [Steroidobacteraceae bacterium]|nr:c-type cytochrome [Steroidobacteraceae bacterium]
MRNRPSFRALSFSAVCLTAVSLAMGATPPDAARAARDQEFHQGAQLEPNLAHGAELFETCAACHGHDGRGTADGSIPAIAGQHGSVLLKQLTDFRHEQRWNERMQNFTDRHHLEGAQDLTDVAAYVASLPRFPPSLTGIGDGTSLGAGASVYFQKCERCHGPLGQGDLLRNRPRLAGQHFSYLLRQLQETAAGQRPGMDHAHVERLQGLTPEQLTGVADYLSRLSPDLSSRQSR